MTTTTPKAAATSTNGTGAAAAASPVAAAAGTSPQSNAATTTTTTTSTLVSARVWEVFSPPPINTLTGALLPRAFTARRNRRKVSIEVHRIPMHPVTHTAAVKKQKTTNKPETAPPSSSITDSSDYYEECIVRILVPGNAQERRAARKLAKKKKENLLAMSSINHDNTHDNDSDDDDDDASTMAGMPREYMDQHGHHNIYTTPNEFDKNWMCKYRFPIKSMSIRGTLRTGVFIHVQLGRTIKQTRQLIFDTLEESEDFQNIIAQELILEEQRSQAKLRVAFKGHGQVGDGDLPSAFGEQITFLLEMVSGWDLPAGDFYTSDPYIIISFNNKDIHRTKYIPKTLDPVWTLRTGALCLFKVNPQDLFLSEGLQCTVVDYDKMGSDEKLGEFYIPPHTIYEGKGERIEFKLLPPPKSKADEVPGFVAIRVRRATEYDLRFMAEYHNSRQEASHHKIHHPVALKDMLKTATDTQGGVGAIASYFRRQTRTIKDEKNNTITQYKLRPGPDPKRVEETTWMTKQDIETESLHDSQHWLDSGTGRLGRIFLEVIGCDDLPNLDLGGRNKTDTFVSIVYEDSVVKTDVIDDCLNPRWMPWMRRAFIFHMFHTSSQIFLGAFDNDDSLNPADDHDLIGRVSVDLANLRRDTTYILKYDIFTTARMSERIRMGTLIIRLRLEFDDDRKMILSNLEPPPDFYVNVKNRRDFRCVRYTCTGKYDMEKYDMKYINSYIEELLAIQHVLYYIKDAAESLLLWRGTMPIEIGSQTFLFPIHSLSAFIVFTYLVERPQMWPSMFFFFIGWFMLAAMDYRRRSPDVWSRCKSFPEFATILAVGTTPLPPANIKPYENQEESQKYLEAWQKRITDAEAEAAKAYEENLKAQEEYEKEMEELGGADTDISSKMGRGVSIDPFKPILYPIQQNLGMLCRYLRYTAYIISWEECYISFWVTTACFLVSFIFCFVPWFFIVRWTARLVVWTVFGPWMKLVDVFYVSKIKPLTEEEKEQKREQDRRTRKEELTSTLAEIRIKKEKAVKLRDMKKYMFGKFITRVPVFKEDRYRDVPLPGSSATPYKHELLPLSEVAMQEAGYRKTRIPGQHLAGDMIPKLETDMASKTEAPIGQATANPKKVDKTGPGGAGMAAAGVESTAQAYAKIGSLLFAAAAISWFVVPLFANLTEKALQKM